MRRILTKVGIKSPKKKKKIRAHHYRKRVDCPGAMVQLDASPYPWLGGGNLNLRGAIDDASSKVLGLYLTKEECFKGYLYIARQMIEGSGIPVSTYNNHHTMQVSPERARMSVEDQLEGKQRPYTQFSAAMDKVKVKIIAEGFPQANGRIEHPWGIL